MPRWRRFKKPERKDFQRSSTWMTVGAAVLGAASPPGPAATPLRPASLTLVLIFTGACMINVHLRPRRARQLPATGGISLCGGNLQSGCQEEPGVDLAPPNGCGDWRGGYPALPKRHATKVKRDYWPLVSVTIIWVVPQPVMVYPAGVPVTSKNLRMPISPEVAATAA